MRVGGAVRFADGHPFPPRSRPRPEELATPEAETDRDKRKGVSKERSVHTDHNMDMGTTAMVYCNVNHHMKMGTTTMMMM